MAKKYAVYVGGGEHIIGLPAHDMAKKEFESYPKELRQAALNAGLYQIESEKDKEVKNA